MDLETDEEETPHLLKDFPNKMDIVDHGGGDGCGEVKIWGPGEMKVKEEGSRQNQSRFVGRMLTVKRKGASQVFNGGKSSVLKEPGEAVVAMGGGKSAALDEHAIDLSELLKEARRIVGHCENALSSGFPSSQTLMEEIRDLYCKINKLRQMAEVAMEYSAKSFSEKQVIGPLPCETAIKGEFMKQHMMEWNKPHAEAAGDIGDDVDVSDRCATTIDSGKLLSEALLLEAADCIPTNTGYGNVDEMDKGKSDKQLVMEAEEMADEENDFALYAKTRDRRSAHYGYFGEMTRLSSTQFTHLLPGTKSYGAGFPPTLQILSIKLTEIKGGLEWPLPVYGVVAVRDTVDHNRNILFARDRNECQRVNRDATILGVSLKGGPWPSKYGGRVVCFAPSVSDDGQITSIDDAQPGEVVLLDSCRGAMPVTSAGYLHLSRQVVSVEIEGSLKVVLQTYSASGDIDSEVQVCFMPDYFNASQSTCELRGVEVDISVAWSRMVTEKECITSRC